MKVFVLFIMIFIFFFPLVLRAEEIPFTLDEAIFLALRDNRDILLKTEDVKKAKAKIIEAQAGLFPTLDFTASRAYTRGYYAKDLGQTTTQATLKQYLYKGGKTINTIQQNKYKLKVDQALLDKTKLQTVLGVEKAFYTLLLAGELRNLNKAILENRKAHLNSLGTRYVNGQASDSDLLKVESSLATAGEAYEASLNQIEAAGVLLNNLLYLDKEVKIKPNDQFSYQPLEVAYDEAFLKAMDNRPEIKQYAAQIRADKEAVEIAKADNRPNIYISWDYYSRSNTSLTFSPTKAWQDYNVMGITFSWPIFDGGQTRAKVEQAIVDLKETQLLKEKTIKDIALELKNAYLALKNALVKLKATEADLAFFKNNLLSAEEKYQQGEVSLLDKDDADLKYKLAAFNKKQAIYDYLIAKSSFDKTTGGL